MNDQINDLLKRNQSYFKEVKELIAKKTFHINSHVLCYFTYSLSLSHATDEDNLLLGSFTILNLGQKPLQHPVICITLSDSSLFKLSGKFTHKASNSKVTPSVWERISKTSNQDEYWFKYKAAPYISANDRLSFSNFQVEWTPQKNYNGTIKGFVYSEEIKDGQEAVNQINISGMTP
ncbi:hypothetical protein HXA34_13430 [Salipaludibacillus agaradhaerens]|jgi:hypothetical protein|uniref:hypothetical protein n=1 Tax=Salipaludibacillus agaradhaerens TaxID=76935 RepID=UPI002150E3EA|nr:hypothetical protein [Salipaludibacillus agaradhaerens]MCR6107301.1 hypothetical protein [Salipaludibacillus agaradhaerens]MCR6111351.1 hypothetical protein [Bacillus sp. A301a_S52]MCR6119330.1 hypothetical protein [Salipaludibacillus agaradhaerens]